MKPTLVRNRQIFQAANHTRSRQLGATLSKELREKHGTRSVRVIKGDTVHVMRGEFKGIDGKVTRVSTEKNSIAIEGIKREKLKGGNIDIFIHTSNVMITDMNLDDKWRQNKLAGQATKTPVEKPKPQEKVKEIKGKPKTETPKEKTAESDEKKGKQTKAVTPTKKENK